MVRLCFFFSSRRRHTRCLSDWSSDVCSSDLDSHNMLTGDVSVRGRSRARKCELPNPHRLIVYRVAVLRSSVATEKREDWDERQLKAGVEVVICHPKLVETGLDLLAFPTLYFYETGYSLHTLRQASRRSWRIGQRHPVRVKFVTYAGTMQETCLRLMGKKMLVALMMEGKFSGEGLQSLDTDEDLMSAMARELVEKAGVGASADQLWKELQSERERVLPQPPAINAEEDDNPVFDLSVTEPIGPASERAGIHLVEPQAGVKVRKKSSPWSTGTGPAVQLSLFG